MAAPMTQQQFNQQRTEHELAQREERERQQFTLQFIGETANQTGLAREDIMAALGTPGARLARFNPDTAGQTTGGYFTRRVGGPAPFLILGKGEKAPEGAEVIEETGLTELAESYVAEKTAARRMVGPMDEVSQAAAQMERDRIAKAEQSELAAIEARLPELVREELGHMALNAEEHDQVAQAFTSDDPRALDSLFIVAESIRHPGTGEEGTVYRLVAWTPDCQVDLADRPGHRVRTLRRFAETTRERHQALARYGERALAAAPRAFGGPLL